MSDAAAPPYGTGMSNRYVLAVLLVVAILAYLLRYSLLPLAISVAVAYAATPLIGLQQRYLRLPRPAAVLAVYFALLGIVLGVLAWAYLSLAERLMSAARDLPGQIGRIAEEWAGPQLHLFGETFPSKEIGQRALENLGGTVLQPDHAMLLGGVVVAAPTTLVLILITLFYFLNSGRRLAEGVVWLAPPRYREEIRGLAARVDPALRRYVIGVFLVVAYTSAVAWVFLAFLFDIPFAYLFAFVVGVLELVPVVGPAVSMVLLIGAAVLHGHGIWHIVGLGFFAIALRVSIDELVGPLLLGRAVTLHPVVIIFAFLFGATLFGVLGVLLAVPLATATKIVLGAWYGEDPNAAKQESRA